MRPLLIVTLLLMAATKSTLARKMRPICPGNWKVGTNPATKETKCYRLHRQKVDLFTAMDKCRTFNAEVLSIESKSKNMLLQHLFNDQSDDDEDAPRYGRRHDYDDGPHSHEDKFIWIGAMRSLPDNSDHSFRWIYGQRLNYSNWDVDEPSNVKENCAVIGPNGLWASMYCYKKQLYACEMDPFLKEKMKQQRLVIFNRELIAITSQRDSLEENLKSHLEGIFILTGLSIFTLFVIAGQIYCGSFRWRKELRNPTNVTTEQEDTYNNNFPSLNFE